MLNCSAAGEKGRDYLEQRGISGEMIGHFGLGLAPTGGTISSNNFLPEASIPRPRQTPDFCSAGRAEATTTDFATESSSPFTTETERSSVSADEHSATNNRNT